VSVHVRRGDVTATANGERFRGLGYFERQWTGVKALLDEFQLPWEGIIHTQGHDAGLRGMLNTGLQLSESGSEYEDFHMMCSSDILIASPSSFSVTAGMISGGVVMRPREWFHTMPSARRWVGVREDGGVDAAALRMAFQAVTSERSSEKF
jgi:hypothetical protein